MIKVPGFRIKVKPLKLEEIDNVYAQAKRAGIIMSDHDDMKAQRKGVDQGTVLAIGPTAFKDYGDSPWCFVGDTIVYAKYSGMVVKDPEDGEDYLIINDEDVVAVVGKN